MPQNTERRSVLRVSSSMNAVFIVGVFSLTGLVGCQEEVIGVRNSYNNPNWQLEQQRSNNQTSNGNGPLEAVGDGLSGVGDALFGWMDGGDSNQPSETQFSNNYAPTIRGE